MAKTFVIIGANATGGSAAAVLREEGFDGRIVLIGDDQRPPYERPPLSKEYLRGEQDAESAYLRPADWYSEQDISTRFGIRAERIDAKERTVELEGGENFAFDALLVATGIRNRKLDVPGARLEGVLDLRRVEDSDRIRDAAAKGSKAAIVGMGFIGAEVAASLRQLGTEVTIVEYFETALFRVLGPAFGRVLEGIHRDHGVEMFFGETVESFEGSDRVEAVVTTEGRRIECDFAVVGIGTQPNVEIAEAAGLAVDNGITIGPAFETTVPGVFAAGDIANHDHPIFGRIRVEHFDNAIKMGPAAAKAMLGNRDAYDDPHWFWSDQYDSQIQMGGFTTEWRDPIIRGSVDDRSFCAFQLGDGAIRASLSIDWKRDVRRSLKLIRAQTKVDPVALADPEVDLRTLLPEGS
ncbi:MAG: FAD-dependent oxidoreductase [Actinomycetota bacterium]